MPESVPLAAWASPHMGSRPAVDQLLSGFVQCRAQLLAGQRIYDLPVTGRIGSLPHQPFKMVVALATSDEEPLSRMVPRRPMR